MKYGYYLIKKNGSYIARFFKDGKSARIIKEMALRKIARALNSDFDGRAKNTKTLAEADNLCKQFIEKNMLENKSSDISVIEYCLHFWDWDGYRVSMENRRKKDAICKYSCVNNISYFNKHIIPNLRKGLTLNEVDSNMIRDLQDTLLEKTNLKKATINKTIRTLTTPLNAAYKTGLIKNPIIVDSLIEDDSDSRGTFAPSELILIEKALIEMENQGEIEEDIRLAVFVAVFTGMRLGELIALTKDQIQIINETDSMIIIDKAWNEKDGIKIPKGKRIRQTIIPTKIAKALLIHCEQDVYKKDRVFFAKNGISETRSPNYFRDNFYKACDRAGIIEDVRKNRKLVFHSLRHTISTRLAGKVDETLIMQTIGHNSKTVHSLYVHPDYEMLKPVGDATRLIFSDLEELKG